ncbi:hypothetical protein L3Q82_007515 [Scortum barcoo]|uniref:Uncharacterized protein n=1 Tax=Scortum barcoo TaxID=214431 RepID=A0ACB8WMK5_9TELE|nr:hypothetical protein L3Q82_007515 [Scortum barcoo]
MKCFERLVKSFITSSILDSLDPLQFAYRPNRSTEDAIALTLHTALSHLDQRDTYVRMLFIDYSSAFNTIVPSKLVTKLRDLGLNSALCDWILNFLTGRPQAVQMRMGSTTSSTLTLNTWRPPGLCAQPTPLYSLFTHDCVATHSSNTINGLQRGGQVRALTSWCQDNNLHLNVSKTKELIVDFRRRQREEHAPLSINGTTVERVNSFRFLGVHISEDLTWTHHTDFITKSARQRLFFLRRLRRLNMDSRIICSFYRVHHREDPDWLHHRLVQQLHRPQPTVQVWTEEASSALQDCFECTDWEVFKEKVLFTYLKFCTDTVLPTKTIKVFPNQKPWLDSTVKPLLKACDAAYSMWRGIKTITDYKRSDQLVSHDSTLPDTLNTFYVLALTHLAAEREFTFPWLEELHQPLVLQLHQVSSSMKRINIRKAEGPDKLATVPVSLKTSIIVPVPKKSAVTCLNDYRPVALTPVIMKCFERIVLKHIQRHHPCCPDPSQQHEDRLFVDFSSAFNIVIPDKADTEAPQPGTALITVPLDHGLPHQQASGGENGDNTSSTLVLNTGTPQGCVLSPALCVGARLVIPMELRGDAGVLSWSKVESKEEES